MADAGRRVVLVTGASAGIGRACCDRLAGGGWTVVGASRRGTAGAGWAGLVMDVDQDAAVAAGVEGVVAEHGRLDAVVAGAGWGLAGAIEETPIAEAKAQLETVFWGAVRVVRAALPALRHQGGGRVVLVGSIGGVIALPFQGFYSAAKFALEGYGEALAYEVAPFGVEVTLVEPGNFRTEFTQSRRLASAPDDSPYAGARDRAVAVMARDEERGADPVGVAVAVARVLEARRPPRRVTVGPPLERAGPLAKRVMPFRLFERAARGSLGV